MLLAPDVKSLPKRALKDWLVNHWFPLRPYETPPGDEQFILHRLG